MKSCFFFLVSLCIAASGVCQSKISPSGRIILNEYQLKAYGADNSEKIGFTTQVKKDVPRVSALVSFTSDGNAAMLTKHGFDVTADLNKVAVVRVSLDKVETLASFSFVRSVSFGEKENLNMNYARPSGAVSDVQSGFSYNGSDMSFTGDGVIVGMMDVGLEANHINFKNDDGSSRIQRLWHMKSDDGSYDEYTTESISRFSTDTNEESHATHVAGIMGGSYRGNGTYRYVASANASSCTEMTNQPIPYYGVAYDADLALSVGELYSTNIIQGVTNIIEYAESVGKPAVINLSLGHTAGPHDGTDSYSQALSELGKRAIICMSAGNDGDVNMSIVQKFTSLSNIVKTSIQGNTASGILDIWSNDNTPLKVTWAIYNTADRKTTKLIEIGGSTYSGSTSGNTEFSTYFNGSIKTESGIDPNNNRFRVYSEINISPKTTVGKRYIVINVEGVNGQTAYIYGGSKVVLAKNNISGYTNGTSKNSINDAACADNIISVGSYNSRIRWGQFNSNGAYAYTDHGDLSDISPFSSYGTSFQGIELPLVSGPGSAVISSYSSYYITKKNTANSMTARASSNNSTYYWGAMQGTSMSCPFVTGTIGLWLQADPTLDYANVMDVINNTSATDSYTSDRTNKGRWGAGKIDALEGIKYVLANKAAIGEVWADDNQRLIVTDNGSGYEVFVADGGQLTATLYDLQGRPVARATGADGTATVDCGSLSSGLYILEARSDSYRLTRKVTRR